MWPYKNCIVFFIPLVFLPSAAPLAFVSCRLLIVKIEVRRPSYCLYHGRRTLVWQPSHNVYGGRGTRTKGLQWRNHQKEKCWQTGVLYVFFFCPFKFFSVKNKPCKIWKICIYEADWGLSTAKIRSRRTWKPCVCRINRGVPTAGSGPRKAETSAGP